MDGLLVETESVQMEAFLDFCRRHGIDFPGPAYAQFVGVSVEENIAWLQQVMRLKGEPAALVAERNRLYRELVQERELEICPGVPELLAAARGDNLLLGVVSSSEEAQVTLVLEKLFAQLGEPGGLAVVVHGGMAERMKPAPDLYLVAARELALAPAACLAFEDSPSGAAAALAAGMGCVVVPGPYTRHLRFPPAARRCASLADCARERVWRGTAAPGGAEWD